MFETQEKWKILLQKTYIFTAPGIDCVLVNFECEKLDTLIDVKLWKALLWNDILIRYTVFYIFLTIFWQFFLKIPKKNTQNIEFAYTSPICMGKEFV